MFKKKAADKFSQYVDPTGEFSNRELKMAEWYVNHKLQLKKIGKGLLIAWCVLTIGYSFSYWGFYFISGYWQDQTMLRSQTMEFVDYDSLKNFYQPRPPVLGAVEVYNSVSEELYDLTVEAENLNERWLLGLAYKFVYDEGETPVTKTVILPRTKRLLAYLGLKTDVYPQGAKLVITETRWRRLNSHVLPDINTFMKDRLGFTISNFKFTPASRVRGVPNHMIEFDLTNATAYNFWEADFYLELLSDLGRAGIIYLPVEKLSTGETRHLDVRSFVSDLQVADIILHPLLNIFDKEAYMPVEK